MEEEYEKLTDALAGSRKMEPEIDDFFKTNAERKVCDQSQTLQERGVVPEQIYYIVKGVARLCFWHTDELCQRQKITSIFVPEGGFAFTPHSFFNRVPSIQSIELVTGGKVLELDYRTVNEARARFLDMNVIIANLKDYYYEQLKERSYILSLPLVRDRYRYLAEHKSWLFQKVPMEHIASYIGTTRENLSRIRSRLR